MNARISSALGWREIKAYSRKIYNNHYLYPKTGNWKNSFNHTKTGNGLWLVARYDLCFVWLAFSFFYLLNNRMGTGGKDVCVRVDIWHSKKEDEVCEQGSNILCKKDLKTK